MAPRLHLCPACHTLEDKTALNPVPDTQALTAMLTAARLGSLSATAVELGVTHGSVSRRIAGLERWLGTQLFVRHGRGVQLTPTGENFARRVETALNDIAALAADIRASHAQQALRISVVPSFARLWLMPRLAALQGAPADLSLEVVTEHRLASLETGEADVAIRVGRGEWPGVDARLLLSEETFPVAAPDTARRLRSDHGGDLMALTLLHDSDAAQWKHWCVGAGVPYRPRGREKRYDDYDLLLTAAEAGLGVALARMPLCEQALSVGRLMRVHPVVVPGERRHYVVTRRGDDRAAVMRLIDRLLVAAGQGSDGLIAGPDPSS